MKSRPEAEVGAACISIFVISSAFRDVYLGGVFQSVSVFLVLLIAFGIATAAGLGLAWLRCGRRAFAPLLGARKDVGLMNAATAGAWICYFLALKALDPSIVNTLFAGIGPFVVIALAITGHAIAAPSPATPLQRALQAGVIASLLALVWVVATGRSGFQSAQPLVALGSAGLALLAGALITVGHLYGKRLDEKGASPAALVGTRFIGLLIVAGVVIAYEGPDTALPSAADIGRLALAATLLIVTPIFFNQMGMARISPLSARVITAFGPVLVFALQQLDQRIAWSTEAFIAIIAYSSLVTMANLTQGRSYRKTVRCEAQPQRGGESLAGPSGRYRMLVR